MVNISAGGIVVWNLSKSRMELSSNMEFDLEKKI